MLESLVLARKSILIAGGTGSGKTSLLNAMSQVIPRHERVVTIEDARELQIQQPNWVAMETVEPYQARGGSRVTIGDLVKNALSQNPDRIVVGEVRGEEAFYLLRALSTGHGGGLGTIHANDGDDALHQVQLLAQMAEVGGLTSATVAAMVGRAVDVVVYQGYFEEGSRRVTEILEITKPGVAVSPAEASYTAFGDCSTGSKPGGGGSGDAVGGLGAAWSAGDCPGPRKAWKRRTKARDAWELCARRAAWPPPSRSGGWSRWSSNTRRGDGSGSGLSWRPPWWSSAGARGGPSGAWGRELRLGHGCCS